MKKFANDFSGEKKQKCREWVLNNNKVYKNILMLPAAPCRDVVYLLNKGYIDKNTTHITVVEREPLVMDRIKSKFKKLGIINPHYHMGNLEDTSNFGPYDLLNIDTEGSLSMPILHWLEKQTFLKDAILAIWLTHYRNNGPFKQKLRENLFGTRSGLKLISVVKDKLSEIDFLETEQLMTAAAVYLSLKKCDSRIDIQIYTEHKNPMFVYKFTNIKKVFTDKLEVNDIIKNEIDFEPKEWENKNNKDTPCSNLTFIQMLIKIPTAIRGQKAYFMSQARRQIERGLLLNKTKKMIRAGWKSAITKKGVDEFSRQTIFQFIERA